MFVTMGLEQTRRYDRIATYLGISTDTVRRHSTYEVLTERIESNFEKQAEFVSDKLGCSLDFVRSNSTRRRFHYLKAKAQLRHKEATLWDFEDIAFTRESMHEEIATRQWRGFVNAQLFSAAYIPWLYGGEFFDSTDVNNPAEQVWITRSEASRIFSISARTLYKWEHEGCDTIHIGGHILHRIEDIAAECPRR